MATSRDRTHHRRDLVAQLINDDPETADLVFTVFAITDPSTPDGAAAHADLMRFSHSLTAKAQRDLKNRASEIVQSLVCLVAYALYVVG